MPKFLIAVLLAAAPAAAQATGHTWLVGNDSAHLYYSDLDLTSAAGRAALLARVERAADRLCRELVDHAACKADAVRSALTGPTATPLQVAIDERRSGTRVAAR